MGSAGISSIVTERKWDFERLSIVLHWQRRSQLEQRERRWSLETQNDTCLSKGWKKILSSWVNSSEQNKWKKTGFKAAFLWELKQCKFSFTAWAVSFDAFAFLWFKTNSHASTVIDKWPHCGVKDHVIFHLWRTIKHLLFREICCDDFSLIHFLKHAGLLLQQ